jgi:group I intron endonuclease
MATFLKNMSGIYKITNTVNNKIYVGCSSKIKSRINSHVFDLNNNRHSNSFLQRSWNKYGKSVFTFEVLEYCEVKDLFIREHYWAILLNVLDKKIGYNIKPTSILNFTICSEETREKLRTINKGKKPSALCIQKRKETTMSIEQKQMLKEARKKIDYVKVHREKKGRKVINTLTGQTYGSLSEICEILGVTKSTLSRKLSGKRSNKTIYKYIL